MKTKTFLFYAAIGVTGYFVTREIIKRYNRESPQTGKLAPEILKKLYASVKL